MKLIGDFEQRRKDTPAKAAAVLCQEAADDLAQALSRLADWGVRIPKRGRLDEAKAALRKVIESNEFPNNEEERLRVINSIILANDLADITGYLDLPLTPDTLNTLNRVVKGNLRQVGKGRASQQAQSELWVHAVLSRGGLQPFPSKPEVGRSRPDYLVEIGSITYGVEVKRPQRRESILPNLEKARDQLHRYAVKGAIIMDLTDCLPEMQPLTGEGDIAEIDNLMRRRIWGRRGYETGYSSVMVLTTVARGFAAERNPPILHLVHYSATTHFGGRAGTLHFVHGERLSTAMKDGLAVVGGEGHPDSGWNRSIKDAGQWQTFR